MARAIIMALLPWFAVLIVCAVVLYLITRVNRGRLNLRRLLRLHADQRGAVQSLSFVLTLPIFIMVMMLIVQVSQLMIGTIVVHYAAFATARAAMVWIPAYVSPYEEENGISGFYADQGAPQDVPVLDPNDPGYGPAAGGMTMMIEPSGSKYEKIRSAAILACMPISPSRDLTPSATPVGHMVDSDAVIAAYRSLAPTAGANQRIPDRIRNKLTYAAENTQVELRFYHKNSEPPLWYGSIDPEVSDPAVLQTLQFKFNEMGFQDQLQVTLYHRFALLPGPGRLLSYFVPNKKGEDRVSQRVSHNGQVYVYPLSAQCIIGNEGQKAVVRYEYHP